MWIDRLLTGRDPGDPGSRIRRFLIGRTGGSFVVKQIKSFSKTYHRVTVFRQIRHPEKIKIPELRRIGLRIQGAPRGAYSLYVTLGATRKTKP